MFLLTGWSNKKEKPRFILWWKEFKNIPAQSYKSSAHNSKVAYVNVFGNPKKLFFLASTLVDISKNPNYYENYDFRLTKGNDNVTTIYSSQAVGGATFRV